MGKYVPNRPVGLSTWLALGSYLSFLSLSYKISFLKYLYDRKLKGYYHKEVLKMAKISHRFPGLIAAIGGTVTYSKDGIEVKPVLMRKGLLIPWQMCRKPHFLHIDFSVTTAYHLVLSICSTSIYD